jgi:hypothetical protein
MELELELDDQFKFGHLLLNERKCRICGEIKSLTDGFYRTHKDRGAVASSYSYECKLCTVERVTKSRKKLKRPKKKLNSEWEYPDW